MSDRLTKRPVHRRVSIGITDTLEIALSDSKIFGNRKDSDWWIIRSAVFEGILAIADYHEKHGGMPGSFRFQVEPAAERREMELNREMAKIDQLLAPQPQET